jgi:hypothetical protein
MRPTTAVTAISSGLFTFQRPSMTAAKLRNPAARPAKPSLNRGPIQVRARRALRALGEASTSQISEWAHLRGGSRRRTDYTRRVPGIGAEGTANAANNETRGCHDGITALTRPYLRAGNGAPAERGMRAGWPSERVRRRVSWRKTVRTRPYLRGGGQRDENCACLARKRR